MVNRLVSVGDDFTLPAAVKVADTNLPARLGTAALNATFVTVLVHNGTAYPARPAGAPAGFVKYIGPVAPTGSLTNDEWLDTSTAPAADTTAPTAVTGLTAGTATATTVPLSWTAATDAVGVTGYEYSTNGSTYTSTGSTGTTYTVTGLTASTAYTLYVRAFDAAGNKGAAVSVAKTTAAGAPSYSSVATGLAPSNYLALGETAGTVTVADLGSAPLTWTINNGFAYGAAGIGDGATAANFGTNGYLSNAAGAIFTSTTAGTIAALVKPTTSTSGIYEHAATFRFYIAAGKLTFIMGGVTFTSNATLVAGTRYHVAVTWDGANVVLYVNGAVDKTTASTALPGAANGTNQLGLGGGSFLNGIGAGVLMKKNAALTGANMLSLAQAAGL